VLIGYAVFILLNPMFLNVGKRSVGPAGIVLFNSIVAFCIPIVVLVIWAVASEPFRQRFPTIYTMNPLTAISLVLCNGSLLLFWKGKTVWSKIVAAIVLATALAKMLGMFGVIDFQIDRFIFSSSVRGNLMAPNTAVNCVLISFSLFVFHKANRVRMLVSQVVAIIVFVIALLAVTSHFYATLTLYKQPTYSPMAVHTAITFLLVSANQLLLQKRLGLMAEFTTGLIGGEIAKKLLPLVVALPILLGWLRIAGQNRGWYDREFGTALLIIAINCLSVVALWYLAYRLNKSDLERTIAAREMLAAKEKAEKAARIKDSFLANMSHEIRTPLNSIIGFSEILGEKLNDPKLEGYIANIQTSGRNLLNIVNEILDLAKLETASVELESQPFALADPLEYVGNSMMPLLLNKPDIKYTSHIDPLLPLYFKGDGFRIGQILLNLANNSVKFTQKGSINIKVRLAELFEDMAMVEFVVEDTGMGVAPDKIENLFKPYTQAELSVTRRFGGTGLGLSIVKHLVKLFKGTIDVKSKLGEGTSFTFRIPLAISEAPVKKNTLEEGITALAELLPKLEGVSVLIAEDHPANQRLFVEIFDSLPASIVMANNGKEAIEKLAVHRFDIILMDLQMPEMNGIEATKAIRASDKYYKDIPILAITANIVGADLQACLDSGMNGYISKPIHKLEMIAKIVSLLQNTAMVMPLAEDNDEAAAGPLFNPSYLMEITGGDKERINQLVAVLMPDLQTDIAETTSQIGLGNCAKAAQSLHKLKNTVGILQSPLLLEQYRPASSWPKAILLRQLPHSGSNGRPWKPHFICLCKR
jgi:signal transduction histidine kinase/AmiR/NasT family two-component response regulator